MKTPWSDLLKYGTTIAALIVMILAGVIMMTAVGLAVVLSKLSLIIK